MIFVGVMLLIVVNSMLGPLSLASTHGMLCELKSIITLEK
jgi:hypothetical protein